MAACIYEEIFFGGRQRWWSAKRGGILFLFLLSLGRILVDFNYPYSPLYLFTYPCI